MKKTVEEALKELPETSEAIASFLDEQGVTGARDDCQDCPLAHWPQPPGDPVAGSRDPVCAGLRLRGVPTTG
jgi:hypothetical protein